MATSQLPTPTLQPVPVPEDAAPLAVIESGASCCGGGSCSTV